MGLLNLFSCREASRRVAEGLEDGPAAPVFFSRLHLLICRHCRKFKRELELIARAAREWAASGADQKAVAALEDRIIGRLSG